MKVKELIKQLKECNPELYVGCYMDDGNILHIEGVDNSMNDRIDINVTHAYEGSEWCQQLQRPNQVTNTIGKF